MSYKACIDAVNKAAGRELSDAEVSEIFERLEAHRKRLEAEGALDGIDRKLRQLAREEGRKAKIAAALERKHAALTAIARDKLERQIDDHVAQGLSYPKAVLAVLEGTARGIVSGRKSVAAYRLAYEARFVGDMMAAIQRAHPHVVQLLDDQPFLSDVVREMFELRNGGQPGRTGNADAKAVADVFAKYAEVSRRDLNGLGANIGKLDGWAGPQVHDPYKLLGVTEDEWIAKILPRLDADRTFGRDQAQLDGIAVEHSQTKAERDALRLDLQDMGKDADRLARRIADLEGRRQTLGRVREVEAARLDERQAEYGANVERLMFNRRQAKLARAKLRKSKKPPAEIFAEVDGERLEFPDATHRRLFEYGRKLAGGNWREWSEGLGDLPGRSPDLAERDALWAELKGFVLDDGDARFRRPEDVDELALDYFAYGAETKAVGYVVDRDELPAYLLRERERGGGELAKKLEEGRLRAAPGQLTARARENAVAATRLRRRTERAHETIARIDGRAAQLDGKLAQLKAMADDLGRRMEQPRTRLGEVEGRLKDLDIARAELRSAVADPVEFLRQAYRTITTGRDNTITARQKGEHVGPANLARSLEKHRVLHFKSADDWLAYNGEFGHGNIFSSMVAHQSRSARLAAQMKVLGPNPEVMLGSLLEGLQLKVRNDPKIADADKAAIIRSLTTDAGSRIGSSLAEVRGLTLAPGHVTAARIGSGIRAVQSMAKLGGAVISSISDLVTGTANLKFHGKPLGQAWADQLVELVRGRGNREQRELAYLVGEGFDGIISHIITPHVAGDGAPGRMSQAMETFFRWSGLTAWTDARRAGAARMLSAYVGSKVGKGWKDLDGRFKHGLGLHGIGPKEWAAIREAQFRAASGKTYVTPDRIADLADDVVDKLIPAADVAGARAAFKVDETTMRQFKRTIPVPPEIQAERLAKFEAWLGRRRDGARLDLELGLRRYFADEVDFAVIETDEQTRRMMYWGTRPGTFAGEALRFVFQFKGFPIAYTNRVLGRAVMGGAGSTPAERLLNNGWHIGHLIAGTLAAGYMAMTAKDMLRGWWPPRDPKDPMTWMAAAAQGGGAGIYGDFLFGRASRFGNGPLETVAGPTLGAGAGALNLLMHLREGDAKAGDAFNVALQNTPFANLWYVRPAADFLVLNSLHEAMSPGYLGRQERMRRKDMGQERLWGGN